MAEPPRRDPLLTAVLVLALIVLVPLALSVAAGVFVVSLAAIVHIAAPLLVVGVPLAVLVYGVGWLVQRPKGWQAVQAARVARIKRARRAADGEQDAHDAPWEPPP